MEKMTTWLAAGTVAVFFTGTAAGVASAEAAEASKAAEGAAVDENLGDVVVTATRSEKREQNIPAATTVLTAEDIHASGAQNAAEALQMTDGFAYASFGQNGAAMGSMANEVTVRGIDNGTLILVNGNPVSWRGKYDLSAIPAGSIERIEIVKGSGSVLYGSEAMAGVINIITKKGASNQVTVGIGNSGQHHYAVNVGDDRLAVTYDFSQWKHGVDVSTTEVKKTGRSTTHLGETKTILRDVRKQSAGFSYQINDRLDFLYQFLNTEATYNRQITEPWTGAPLGALYNRRKYTTDRQLMQLNYKDKLWKGSLYFNTGTVESDGPTNYSSTTGKPTAGWYNTREKNITYGLDAQRRWKFDGADTLIAGASLQREQFDKLAALSTTAKEAAKYARNNWAVFTSWEHGFDAKNTMTLGARETWTTGADKDKNYSNFSASGSWLHKMDAENSLYASIAQSFIMPTFAQMYGSTTRAIPNYSLNPQKGVNYEIGWKEKHAAHTWKAALFHTDITDNISASWKAAKSSYEYTNEDFRNTGVELTWDIDDATPFSYHWGVTWQNPEAKSTKKGYWDRKYGRIQLTGGVKYHAGKWTSDLTASFLGDRVQAPSDKHSFDTKPYLLTRWNTIYAPDAQNELSLAITNVLDRHDVISHAASTYYHAPISYLFNYTYKF